MILQVASTSALNRNHHISPYTVNRHFWVVGYMLGCETNPSLNPLVIHQDDIRVYITLYIIFDDDWVIPKRIHVWYIYLHSVDL